MKYLNIILGMLAFFFLIFAVIYLVAREMNFSVVNAPRFLGGLLVVVGVWLLLPKKWRLFLEAISMSLTTLRNESVGLGGNYFPGRGYLSIKFLSLRSRIVGLVSLAIGLFLLFPNLIIS
jgi:hydrogenase/urease accessory protein HupE